MSNWNQKNAFLLEDTPLDQFKCETHENFICKIAAIKISYHNNFCSKHSCDNSLSYYWVRKWDDCSNGNVTLPSDHGNEATHQEWATTAIIIAVYIRKSWWAKDVHELVSEDFAVVHWYVQTKDSRPRSINQQSINIYISGLKVTRISFPMTLLKIKLRMLLTI